MVNRVLLFFVFMAVLGVTVSHGQNGFITYPPSTGGGGGSGPCVLTGSQTTGFVLTATDNSLGCSWQAAGASTIDNNSLKAAVYCADGGGANTITCPISSYPATFSPGQQVIVKINTTSTGPTTIVITNSGGALASKAVTRNGNAAIAAGNHIAGRPYLLVYDGTEFVSVTFTPVSGVDFAPATSGSAILKGNGAGGFSNAVSATDYAPATTGTSILKASAGGFANAVSATDYAPATTGSSILKASAGGFANAVSATDYAPATTGSSILKASAGGFANAVGGTDYEFPLTFSAPLSRATNAISCIAATGSVAGCLSATDWTTFNSKQNAITNPVTGTGANTQCSFWNSGTSITGSANCVYAAGSGFTLIQGANNTDAVFMSRFTDSSPTGNFIHLQNAAKNADIVTISVAGDIVANSFKGNGTGPSYLELPQTAAPSLGTNSVIWYSPVSTTSQARVFNATPYTGIPLFTNVSGVMTETPLSTSGTGTTLCLTVSCAMTTPNLGTPSALVLTNATGTPSAINLTNGTALPITGIAGLGTGVGTWLATPSSANLASAITDETGSGALVFGTAPTITLANSTGLPISTGVSGLGTGVATFLGTPSSANLASALTDETGTGASVFGTSPTITNPSLGATPSAIGRPFTAGTGGCTANTLGKFDASAPAKIIQLTTSDVTYYGVCATTVIAGVSVEVKRFGTMQVLMDGNWTASNTAIPSVTTAGWLHDSGVGRSAIPMTTSTASFVDSCSSACSGTLATIEFVGTERGIQQTKDIGVTFDAGDGSALSGTSTRCMNLDYAATIKQATLIGDVSGNATLDVKTVAYASYTGPASASSITAAAIPALASAVKFQDATLTGWTTALAAGTEVCFVLSSPATVQWVNATLKVTVP